MSPRKHVVLCSTVLGGAEIFTLERLLRVESGTVSLHCNSELARTVRKDARYDNVPVVTESCLDALALRINVTNIVTGARGLQTVLAKGDVLLGNLRAAALMLHSAAARANDAFIHDNSHYLNLKAQALIALIVLRSRTTFFPCHHSTVRVPFRHLLLRRMVVDYFALFRQLEDTSRILPSCLKMAVVGRIEPAKNQLLAIDIANQLATVGVRVHLTLVGSQSDSTYCSNIMATPKHPALKVCLMEVRRSEIPELLVRQDMVLHTSIAESLPLVLFEANALGIPFFALPTGGIPEVLPQKYWIYLDAARSVRQILTTLYGTRIASIPSQHIE